VPWISVIGGATLLLISIFGDFEHDSRWKELLLSTGKAILAGGVFAVLLKYIQIMGAVREELTKIIYDQQYLKNRNDLPKVWENISKVMFKNKFPKISRDIVNDVKN